MPASSKTTSNATRRYRERMRALGFRQVNLWLPDTRSPAFVKECRRQSRLASQRHDDVDALLDEALSDVEGWTR
ncbi:DUF3018 family protein [Vineibacter terrae]|uniref:DUF3018 family protein n=1 Tax=Vineibacter terrae TaxID=2586908 RepID=A0A5C8P8A9_9HYPH|nr:antitoxin MazE family protein [Vineibacter terrae]TXL69694.1 DUF3018 family protein [Vineibacter terrae]